MQNRNNYNDQHWVTILVLVSLLPSMFISEWNFNRMNYIYPRIVNIIGYILPLIILIFLSIKLKVFWFKKNKNNKLTIYNIFVIYIIFILLFQSLGFMGYNAVRYVELSVIQAILYGYLGFWLAADEREAVWLLSRIAFICSIIGCLVGIEIIFDIEKYKNIFPMWGINLIVAFGYSWYLYQWISGHNFFNSNFVGLIACSISVWVSFQKPLLFMAGISTILCIYLAQMVSKNRMNVFRRFFILVLFAITSLYIADILTDGNVMNYMLNVVYESIIRIDKNVPLTQLDIKDIYSASGGRLDMWPIAIELFQQNPLFGGGQDVWGIARHPHNWFLDMILWVGLIGSLPFFLGLICWYKVILKKNVILMADAIMIPCLCYITGLMAYNIGGSIRIFHTISSLALLLMAISVKRRLSSIPSIKVDEKYK